MLNIQFKVILFLILFTVTSFQGFTQSPKLIEFGWDYPDVDQLSKGLSSMQNTPFDGICFSLQRGIMGAFDPIVQPEDYFEYKKLKTLQWGKYKDNFILLLGYGQTGGHWFDDEAWKGITKNMEGLSKAMSAKGIKGILFDPEYYLPDPLYNPWTYNKKQYPNQSLEVVQSMVKKRGMQFINALQKYRINFSFLSLWITSLIVLEKTNMPMVDTRQVLLLSFFEGLMEAKNKTVTVIDGNENAYWYYAPSQFLESSAKLNKHTAELMKSKKAISAVQNIELAQPVFYDGLMGMAPDFERGRDNINKWKWVEANTKYAMASSDKFVWFYSQRINWWKNMVNDTLIRILKNSKLEFNSPSVFKNKNAGSLKETVLSSSAANTGKGYYYSNDLKAPWKTEQVAFSFKWNAADKNLQIKFPPKMPESITLFINNTYSKINYHQESIVNIRLTKFKKGKIIVLAKYKNNLEALGFQTYGQ